LGDRLAYDRLVSVSVFFNPDLVERLTTCGITARRQQSPGASARGFVLANHGTRPQSAITHVIDNRPGVIITGRRQLPAGQAPEPATITTQIEPQTALELAEECARLRRDNRRLSDEVARLRAQVDRLTASPSTARQREENALDDAATRFSLLELD
jgi:hypothetical protein